MITGLSSGFVTMVQSQAQVVEAKVTITLPAGTYSDFTFAADNITIEAQTVTDLPDQSRMQVGYPSMGATFTLSGLVDLADATKTAAWLFRRYNTASPLYRTDALRAPVTIDVGLYPVNSAGVPELVRKFTGYIDSYVEVEDGGVQFTCIDKRTLLRSVPETPPVVTQPPFDDGLTSEYALDNLLRAVSSQTISSWPARRPGCVFAAGFRTSTWAELGDIGAFNPPTFAPGVFGTAFTAGFAFCGFSASTASADVFFEGWVISTAATDTIQISAAPYPNSDGITLNLVPTGSNIVVNAYPSGSTTTFNFSTLTLALGAHYIGLKVHWPIGSTSWNATLYVDGASYATGGQTIANARTSSWAGAVFYCASIEATQVTTESAPVPNNGFVPQAVLDPSLNSLTVIPGFSGDPWQVIQEIGSAELAVTGFDESGIFRLHNRNSIRSVASARDVTTAEALQIETHSASVINRAQVGFTAWNYGAAAAVWSLNSVWRVPKNSTGSHKFVRYATVTDGTLFTNIDTTLTFMNNAGTTTAGQSYYRTSVDAAGTRDHPGVTIVLTQVSSTKVRVEITNATSQDCYLVASADHAAPAVGTPVLIIGGTPVSQANETQTDYQYPAAVDGGAVSSRFGEVAWQQTGNAWIQDGDSAVSLAQDVVLDGYVPRPNLTNITIIPDPRLQLVDVVHIVDPDTTYVDEYARIFGWTLTLSHESWAMTLDARSVAPPGAWILGVAGRSELAQTTYLQGA